MGFFRASCRRLKISQTACFRFRAGLTIKPRSSEGAKNCRPRPPEAGTIKGEASTRFLSISIMYPQIKGMNVRRTTSCAGSRKPVIRVKKWKVIRNSLPKFQKRVNIRRSSAEKKEGVMRVGAWPHRINLRRTENTRRTVNKQVQPNSLKPKRPRLRSSPTPNPKAQTCPIAFYCMVFGPPGQNMIPQSLPREPNTP